MKKLEIDTTNHKITRVSFDGVSLVRESTYGSQNVLPMIEELGADIPDRIQVVPGPGSYTGIRVGMVIGKTLAWLLGIPVNNAAPHQDTPIRYGLDRW